MIRGREAFKTWVKQFQDSLLDARPENLEVFSNATGDRVVSRWICTGKNNGLLGVSRLVLVNCIEKIKEAELYPELEFNELSHFKER